MNTENRSPAIIDSIRNYFIDTLFENLLSLYAPFTSVVIDEVKLKELSTVIENISRKVELHDEEGKSLNTYIWEFEQSIGLEGKYSADPALPDSFYYISDIFKTILMKVNNLTMAYAAEITSTPVEVFQKFVEEELAEQQLSTSVKNEVIRDKLREHGIKFLAQGITHIYDFESKTSLKVELALPLASFIHDTLLAYTDEEREDKINDKENLHKSTHISMFEYEALIGFDVSKVGDEKASRHRTTAKMNDLMLETVDELNRIYLELCKDSEQSTL
jgi:hypothetical protein